MTITRTIPARDGYSGLTEASDASGRTWVVCGTGPDAQRVLLDFASNIPHSTLNRPGLSDMPTPEHQPC